MLRDASEDSCRNFRIMSTSLSNSGCPNAVRAPAGSPAGSLMGNVANGAAHLKAIAGQLEGVREDFAFVLGLLKNPDWSAWGESSGTGTAARPTGRRLPGVSPAPWSCSGAPWTRSPDRRAGSRGRSSRLAGRSPSPGRRWRPWRRTRRRPGRRSQRPGREARSSRSSGFAIRTFEISFRCSK